MVLHDAGIVLHLRARLLSRLLLSRFTPEAKRAAPYRLAAVLLIGVPILLLFGVTLGHFLILAFNGQSLRPFLLPAFVWSPTAATVGIFFYAVLSLTATFTYRNDLSLLMLTPISPRVVLADKLFAVCASFSILMAVIGMPDLIGAGRALHAGTEFTLVAVVVVLALPIPAAALAMLVSILVLRWLPPAKARGGSAVVGTVAAAVLYGAAQTFGDVTVRVPWGNVNVVPTVWPGHALIAATDGHTGTSLLYLAAFVLFALGLAAMAIDRASYHLASGWTVYGEVGRRRNRRRAQTYAPRRTAPRVRRTPSWWPVVRKEWLTLRRDPKLLAQLAYPLLIEGYSFYHAFGNPLVAHPITGSLARYFAASLYLSSSMTALFLLSVLALPIVSREGRSLYLLGLVPVRAGYLLLAKILFCLAPVVVLLEVLLFTMAARLLSLSLLQTLYVGAVLFALVSALSCWLVCVGLIWPRLTSDGSRRQVNGTALIFGPTSGGLLCALVGFLLAGSFRTQTASWAPTVSGAAIFVLTGGVIVFVFSVGPRIFHDLLVGDRRPA